MCYVCLCAQEVERRKEGTGGKSGGGGIGKWWVGNTVGKGKGRVG